MSGQFTAAERLQYSILIDLHQNGPGPGWEIWSGIAEERELDVNNFRAIKREFAALEREGAIVKTGKFDNSAKKGKHWGTAVWRMGDDTIFEGFNRRVREQSEKQEGDEDTVEYWLDRRVTGGLDIPRGTWRKILDGIKAGELYIEIGAIEAGDE